MHKRPFSEQKLINLWINFTFVEKQRWYNFPLLLFFLLPDQKPDVMYADIGGMDIQKQEVREAVELPLTHFELYKQVRHSTEKHLQT